MGRVKTFTNGGRLFPADLNSIQDWADRKLRTGMTFAIAGTITVPAGDTDLIPPAFVPTLPAAGGAPAQAATLVAVRYQIHAGTSATFKVQRNGVDVAGLTGLVATPASGGAPSAPTDPTVITDGDLLAPVVTAVAGTPKNLTITLILEHVC